MDFFYLILQEIQFKDVVDISLVTFFIYQALLIIKGTRAVQMAMGVGALIIVYGLSARYQLFTINWLLSHFFDSLLIILVIVFQDQIRNALATFGAGKIWAGLFGRRSREIPLEEIIEGVNLIQRSKVGALIVIEQTHGLDNFMATGTRINGEVHADLLVTLFQRTSQLHDGGVIISKGKLGAAGCFFPLSKHIEVDRHMGSRHRAALGISEVTDGIAISVSEESGQIRLWHKGVMTPVKDLSEIHGAISAMMEMAKPSVSGVG